MKNLRSMSLKKLAAESPESSLALLKALGRLQKRCRIAIFPIGNSFLDFKNEKLLLAAEKFGLQFKQSLLDRICFWL